MFDLKFTRKLEPTPNIKLSTLVRKKWLYHRNRITRDKKKELERKTQKWLTKLGIDKF